MPSRLEAIALRLEPIAIDRFDIFMSSLSPADDGNVLRTSFEFSHIGGVRTGPIGGAFDPSIYSKPTE